MVNATDLFVLALGGLLTVAFLYRDRLPFIGAPTKTPTPAAKTANGAAEAAAALGGYQGDVRDFATRMKDQVSAPRSARRGRLSEGWKGPRRRGGGGSRRARVRPLGPPRCCCARVRLGWRARLPSS